MNLHEEFETQLAQPRAPVDLDHREHGDVRGAALDRGVDTGAQRVPTSHLVAAGRLRKVPVSTQKRVHLALLRSLLVLHSLPLPHLRPVAVPQVHSLLRLLGAHVEVLREAVRGFAVRDGKVENLRLSTLRREHILHQRRSLRPRVVLVDVSVLQQTLPGVHGVADLFVHAHRGPRVEIAPRLERLPHGHAPSHVRQ